MAGGGPEDPEIPGEAAGGAAGAGARGGVDDECGRRGEVDLQADGQRMLNALCVCVCVCVCACVRVCAFV